MLGSCHSKHKLFSGLLKMHPNLTNIGFIEKQPADDCHTFLRYWQWSVPEESYSLIRLQSSPERPFNFSGVLWIFQCLGQCLLAVSSRTGRRTSPYQLPCGLGLCVYLCLYYLYTPNECEMKAFSDISLV